MKKVLAILSLLATSLTLTACNTMAGAGKDIERGGQHLQNSAEETKRNM